jgi:hypothetical protein
MSRLVLALAALSCAAPLHARPPAKAPAKAAAEVPTISTAAAAEYVLREGGFSVRPPKGWPASRDPREDARQKVFGVRFSGPRSDDGVLTLIDLAYYPPGNAVFRGGADEYLKRNHNDDPLFTPPIGETIGPLEKTVLGGRDASRFSRVTREYLPPHPKGVETDEEVTVVPAKSGFYVVTLKSSKLLHEDLEAAFARVLGSVRFSDPKPPQPTPL